MKRRIASLLIALIGLLGIVAACGSSSPGIDEERQATELLLQRLLALYPVPQLDTSLERGVVVQLFGMRNEARNTYAVGYAPMSTQPVWDCPSIGYPIPYDVQLTNPLQVTRKGYTGGYSDGVVEQAEPNGLYSSKSTSATWTMCVAEDGEITPIYWEPNVGTFPFPVTVDYSTGRITRVPGSEAGVTVDLEKALNPTGS